ncbi:putative cell wall glucanase [Ascodesmis nigricans]|uniref:Crh-like protein n=1 Tax=Ascodesmis nigricans TaxID=341454 RepID=A0A4V3SIM3_9PEZI|nr:putative cell wall glucanase [Ascodesmis nigricans]
MVRLLDAALLGAVLLSSAVNAVDKIIQDCGSSLGARCPESKPCCSQYGQCGVGAFCLGGCDPKWSLTKDYCVPHPTCKSKVSRFPNDKSVISKLKYLGDASKHDWVLEGAAVYHDNQIILTMPKNSAGAVLSSTEYVWYGKISATLRTSRGAGVVSSFITMSDMKDEIDFEWIGDNLQKTESNWYWQGVPDYTHGGKHEVKDTFASFHTYEIDWQPEMVRWSIDGKELRRLEKKSTYNETSKTYQFPQTPSRVQLSLWPGGLESNAEGTVKWAGGYIDWDNHVDMKTNGYYSVIVKEISIECYNPPANAQKKGDKAYTYSSERGLEADVVISNEQTVLKTLIGTGMNMTADDATGLEGVETIPGLSSAGTGATSVSKDREEQTSNDGSSGSGSSSGTGRAVGPGGFSQNLENDKSEAPANKMQGSMFAIIIAVAAIIVI